MTQQGSGAGAPAGCGAEPREENCDFRARNRRLCFTFSPVSGCEKLQFADLQTSPIGRARVLVTGRRVLRQAGALGQKQALPAAMTHMRCARCNLAERCSGALQRAGVFVLCRRVLCCANGGGGLCGLLTESMRRLQRHDTQQTPYCRLLHNVSPACVAALARSLHLDSETSSRCADRRSGSSRPAC